MKRFDICGVGSGIMDILVSVSEEELNSLNLRKGAMALADGESQRKLISRFKEKEKSFCSGGSAANTVTAASGLGARGSYLCCLGEDEFGRRYRNEFKELGVSLGIPPVEGDPTGTCLVMVTPDSERTMQTCLGASLRMRPEYLNESDISDSRWLYLEGYLFGNGEAGRDTVKRAVEIARGSGCKTALSFSDLFIVENYNDALKEALPGFDLIFANQSEACAFTGKEDVGQAFKELKSQVPSVVVTMGDKGARLFHEEKEAFVEAFKCTPVDSTGAGDMFAGAVLYGLISGAELEQVGTRAAYLSMKAVSSLGARLKSIPQWHLLP